jgi:polysaccharide biosynthesis transport protein
MDPQRVEFFDYVNSLRRRRRLILWIWVPLVLVTLLLAVALPSQYGSTVPFKLKTDHDDHARADTYLDRYISGLADSVLGSPELRVAVISLAPYPRLKDDPGAAIKRLREDVDVVMTTEKILDPLTGLERKVNKGFTVTYTNGDPEIAQRVAVWLAKAFQAESRQAAATEVLNESHFYATEAERLRAKITRAEDSLAQFSQENFDLLPDTVQETRRLYDSTEQELESVERDLRSQQQQHTFAQQQLHGAQAAGGVDMDALHTLEDEHRKHVAVYGPNHPDVIALRKQIEAMRAGNVTAGTRSRLEALLAAEQEHLAGLRQRYNEEHPDVKASERRIQELQAGIDSGEKDQGDDARRTPAVVLLQTQLNGVETQIDALEQQREELLDKRAKLQSRLQKAPEVERTYDTLKRDVETAREPYEQLNRRRADAETRVAAINSGAEDRFVLVALPSVPNAPTKPHRVGIALIGLIGATFLALMAALGAIALDRSVRGSHDVAMLLSTPPIAVVPLIRNAEFVRRRHQRLTALTATTLIAMPVLYLVIRFAVR